MTRIFRECISIFSTTSAGRGEDDERLSSDNGGFTDSDFGSSNQGAPGQQGQPWGPGATSGGGPAEGMARAIYHRPRGANQAFVLQEDPHHHHHQQFHGGHNQMQQQQPIASRGPPHQHQRLPQEGRTPEAYSRARMVATQMQGSQHPQPHQGLQPQGFHPNQSPQVYPQVSN